MAILNINGHRIKVRWFETILPLWDMYGDVRRVPRNIYSFHAVFAAFCVALFALPLMWLLSHVPFIWPEMLGGFAITICICVGMNPYQDYFRALVVLAIVSVLLYYNVQFDVRIFGFHVEHYLYYLVILACLATLLRRFYNRLCWKQIDSICAKYGIPYYDQKTLMDAHVGYDTHYGEKQKAYDSYQAAVDADKENQTNQ
ncbi:MAG: hypothetical protein COV52_09700 [Gammaproteobacteria bacterium CG11_big_fil_rev_8_21_14_0_20_46_22]|nr:MAG: hypothetical protein COV52_09700 [Gammaproteobacteria bacterium CG11_big_fil_rev_8_21_14_0_20_46_22]